MTREEILKVALDAISSGEGDIHDQCSWKFWDAQLIRFARAIAAAERERCAKVCEEKAIGTPGLHGSGNDRRFKVANECADAIHHLTDEKHQ